MNIVIIKYNAGNSRSLAYSVERLGYECCITDDVEKIKQADKVLFPGQGEASSAMAYLKEKKIDLIIKKLQQPVLGICLGMQLMCKFSEEGNTNCFGLLNIDVKKFDPKIVVPHMGWNTIYNTCSKLFNNISDNAYVYFANSFYVPKIAESIATTQYDADFSAAININNFYGIQFHPEKSGCIGEQILKNFIELC